MDSPRNEQASGAPEPPPDWAARLTRLEELYLHQERLLRTLDEVVRDVQQRLSLQEQRFRPLVARLDDLAQGLEEQRSPEEERPPHY